MKRIKHYLEFLFCKILMILVSFLPIRINYFLGEGLGFLLYLSLPKIRKRTIDNLSNAFPDKGINNIRKIAKNTYRNFGRMLVEFMFLKRIKNKIIESTEIIGLENLKEIYKEKKGAIILTAHISSLHVMALAISSKISPLYNIIIRLQKNKRVGMLIKKQLENLGMKVIMEYDLKGTIEALKEGNLVEFLYDQDAGSKGIFCKFFKRPASTSPAPIILSMRTHTPIFFVVDVCENNRHKVIIEKPIYPKSREKEEIVNIAQRLNDCLEEYIKRYPDQWFWLHNRWETLNNQKALQV